MDFFRWDDGISDSQYLNGIVSATWIERYSKPGEFTIKAPVSSAILPLLQPDTFVSHLDTREVMRVENVEIDEDEEFGPVLTATGRSFTAFLEERVVGSDIIPAGGAATSLPDYSLEPGYSYDQAAVLINLHTLTAEIDHNPDDSLLFWEATANLELSITPEAAVARIFKRGPLSYAIEDLLGIDDCGIRALRPVAPDMLSFEFLIHNGRDKLANPGAVVFSYLAEDLVRPRYFWSNKGAKTHAYVVSTYNELRVENPDPELIGAKRRIMFVDASDIDSQWTELPTGVDQTSILEAMYIRGLDALLAQGPIALVSTDIAQNTAYKYRRDYDIGDVVGVSGNYGVSSTMRVVEYAEFQDENGDSGYPTLAAY